MKTRNLIAVCAVPLVVCGVILAQQPTTPPPGATPNLPPTVGRPQAVPPTGGSTTSEYQYDQRAGSPAPSPTWIEPKGETKPENLTIEQLIEAMEKTRAEIAEREKLNQVRLKVLQEKVGKVKVRMDSFGGNTPPAAPPVPLGVAPPLPPATIPGPSAPTIP